MVEKEHIFSEQIFRSAYGKFHMVKIDYYCPTWRKPDLVLGFNCEDDHG